MGVAPIVKRMDANKCLHGILEMPLRGRLERLCVKGWKERGRDREKRKGNPTHNRLAYRCCRYTFFNTPITTGSKTRLHCSASYRHKMRCQICGANSYRNLRYLVVRNHCLLQRCSKLCCLFRVGRLPNWCSQRAFGRRCALWKLM